MFNLHWIAAAVPDGLVVDPISRLVFLADTGDDAIIALSTNLAYHTYIITNGLREPRGLAIDPFEGYVCNIN